MMMAYEFIVSTPDPDVDEPDAEIEVLVANGGVSFYEGTGDTYAACSKKAAAFIHGATELGLEASEKVFAIVAGLKRDLIALQLKTGIGAKEAEAEAELRLTD